MTFQKGQSGNPLGGRVAGWSKKPKEVTLLAQQHTEAAIANLVRLMESDDSSVSLDATEALLSRGWGKPAQAVTVGGSPDDPVQHEHHIVLISPQRSRIT